MGAQLIRPAAGSVPTKPGIYMFRDEHGRVVYVGKAKSLRSRLSNYWAADLPPRTEAMVDAAAEVEWIVTESEVAALHLEVSLIKEHLPRYNVRYRDDKSYPYLAITIDEEFPRARVMRGAKRKGVRYYGPFAHAYAIRDTLDLLLRTFPMRTCSQGVFDRCKRRGRPCLLFHIERCSGPCVGAVDGDTHRAIALELCDFLDGNTGPVLNRLEREMKAAATREEFEVAAKMRDQLDNVRKAIERQQMVSDRLEDFDVIGFVEDDLEAAFQVFLVRKGRVTGRKGFIVDKVEDLSGGQLVGGLIERLYVEGDVPRRILVPEEPPDVRLLEQWLRQQRGGPVSVVRPQRGNKRNLLETVTDNAMQAFQQHRLKRSTDFAARSAQLNELQAVIGMNRAPLRIECYDISNTGPSEAVGSMVVFEDGLPKKSDYRRFAIKWTTGPNDVEMMGEVIRRRFARGQEVDAVPKGRFAYPPQLLVVDGGKGQLNRAVVEMANLGVQDVAAIGLAKRMEEVYVPGRSEPLLIPRGSEALYLLQRIRDEAHRFANAYHSLRRTKKMTRSALEGIPGLGEVRRTRLLKHFGSVKQVRAATVEQIAAVPGIPVSVAENVYESLHGRVA